MIFLNIFQKAVNDMIAQMITKVAEEPLSPQHSKQLREKKAMPPPPKTNDTYSTMRQNSIDLHQTIEMNNIIRQFVRSDSGSTDHV